MYWIPVVTSSLLCSWLGLWGLLPPPFLGLNLLPMSFVLFYFLGLLILELSRMYCSGTDSSLILA